MGATDGVDPARRGGPKSGIHVIYNFSISVLNLPPALFYSSESIFPLAMANANDCKGTFAAVLGRFVEELLQLEDGVRVFVNGGFMTIRATLVAVKGDAKAVHEILGFLSCSARHFCPLCMISRDQLHRGQIVIGPIRTPAATDHYLQRIQENPAVSTECGLRYRTCLHDSRYFRAENNATFDLMHDGPEGIIMMVIRLCLKQFVCVDNEFQVEELNQRIFAFDYGRQNSRDKPTPNFSYQSLETADTTHSQVMNAGQTMVLFRALPFLLDSIGQNGIAEDNDYLQYFLLLLRIFEIACAPRLPRNVIPYLRRLLETFRVTWYNLFPNVHPINKFHHLMHLPDNILRKGPQRAYWCFKEEGKNCPLRRHVVICNNFKNPQKTAMEQAQIHVSKFWGTHNDTVQYARKFVKSRDVTVAMSPARLHLVTLGFEDGDKIRVCDAVTVWSFVYRVGEFLLYSKASENGNGLPRFAKILSIVCPNYSEQTWFAVEPWETIGLVERFNSYSIAMRKNPPTHLIDLKDLPIHPPLKQEVDGSSFIEMTEGSLRANFPSINFGQRKEEKFLFSSNNQQIVLDEIFDAALIKVMSPKELSVFLQDKCRGVLPETIVLLLNEEVDGESFLEFTDNSLLSNFPDLSCKQRLSILKVIANASYEHQTDSPTFQNVNVSQNSPEDDLGCGILQGFVDGEGYLRAVTDDTRDKIDVAPCFSASFLKKRKKDSKATSKKPKFNSEDVLWFKLNEALEP
ncbi:Chaperone protein DnaJ [Frankliniella fusca]|uniref:Chaperone protein DnaJ n=1 Tax=Frankliniella fusca TaxID=407009 RepID=A0AAE1LAD4_9NEOP|nr:Chaperone protein DnaJ [Frankliniella fusca]